MSRLGSETPDATGSALDLRPAVLLDPASIHLHGDHMRRRGSDINRLRPTDVLAAAGPSEAIELSPIVDRTPRGDIADAYYEYDTASLSKRDVESVGQGGGADGSVSAVPSLAEADGASSSAPFVSSLERERQRRKALLCFVSLCFCFFLSGWNDGSTGPLLPTIQRHYDVRDRVRRIRRLRLRF